MTSPLFPVLGRGLVVLWAALALPLLPMAQEAAAPAATPAESLLPAITVSAVRPLPMRDRVIASGLVAAVEEIHVQPLVSGEAVRELLADVGDTVAEGDVLARLEGAELDLRRSELAANRAAVLASIAQAEANLIEARANASEAERVATRAATLRQQGNIAAAQADQAASALESAQARVRVAELGIESARAQLAVFDAQLATLELRLGRTEVRSPAAGLVVARNATVGEIASGQGQPMFVIVRDGAMELRAEVAEADLARLAPGMAVSLSAVGATAPLSGTIRMIEPVIDARTRLGIARVALDAGTTATVRQGMFLTADITIRAAEVMAVPVTAVGAGAEGATVMRVVDGTVERVPVVTGIRDAGLVEIVSGLAPGDLVVTKAASFVREGDRIRPVGEDGLPLQGEG
jgi:HlyD family secretion protein